MTSDDAARPSLRGRRRPRARDQDASPFSLILDDLLSALPFVRSAAIFDYEGETVDYAGDVDPFELRVAAATFQLVINELRGCPLSSSARELCIVTGRSGYVLRILDESYTLLVLPRRLATFGLSARLLDEVEGRILEEAGLAAPKKLAWFHVHVEVGPRGRPLRVRPAIGTHAWMPVEVLGAVMGLKENERGFRVRLSSGAELTLLQEGDRLWFVDERLDPAGTAAPPADLFRTSRGARGA